MNRRFLLFLAAVVTAAAIFAVFYWRNRPLEMSLGRVETETLTAPAEVEPPPSETAPASLPTHTAALPTSTTRTTATRPPPGVSATPKPTAQATDAPLFSGAPQEWLPAPGDLPAELQLQNSGSGTNQEIANQFENPQEVLDKLNAWGRADNYMQVYVHNQGCSVQSGLWEVYLQAVLYADADGAQQALDWYIERNREKAAALEPSAAVGQSGYILQLNDVSSCTPPGELSIVSVAFQRGNVLGFVDVGGLSLGDEDSANLQTLALRLAQIIDYNIFSSVR